MIRTPLALAVLLAAACAPADHSAEAAGTLTALADRYVAAWVETFPQDASAAGAATVAHDRLPDLSPATYARWRATEDSLLAALEAVDTAALPDSSAAFVTHGFLGTVLRNGIGWRICRMELWNVSPTWTGPLSVHGD
jgi:uncharacterized protein (DUF885 family)